jgi:hypothetical protein
MCVKWISCKKRFPKTIGRYRIKVKYLDHNGKQRITISTDEFNSSRIFCQYGWQKHNADEVTHWQPLPTPPKVKGE